MSQEENGIPIWFFIGILLSVYGVLILGAGIHSAFVPPKNVALAEYHAGIWWGIVLMGIGSFYAIRFRPRRERSQGR